MGVVVVVEVEVPIVLLLLVWLEGEGFGEKSDMANMADGDSQTLDRTSTIVIAGNKKV